MLKKDEVIKCPGCGVATLRATADIDEHEVQGQVRLKFQDTKTEVAPEWYPLIVAFPSQIQSLGGISVVDIRCSWCGYGLLKAISQAIFEGNRIQGVLSSERPTA